MEIELQKINNIVIISNDAIIGNENAGMKKVKQLEHDMGDSDVGDIVMLMTL